MPDIYSAFNTHLLVIRVVIVIENSAHHLKVNLKKLWIKCKNKLMLEKMGKKGHQWLE